MLENIFFYIVFFSQILLISVYYPKLIMKRVKYVLKNYPPIEYPRLYVISDTEYSNKFKKFKLINDVIAILGLITLLVIAIWDFTNEGNISKLLPFFYFVFQAIPFILLEKIGFTYFKLMRKADPRSKREANLLPRRLFNFVSPVIFGLAIFLLIACLLFYYSIHQFEFHFRNDTFVIALSIFLSHLLYAGIIYKALYGKKLDPYQASKDRMKQIEITIKSILFMSIAASIFFIISEVVKSYNLDYLWAAVVSLYFQFIIFFGFGYIFRNMKIDQIDFDVYKEDASVVHN